MYLADTLRLRGEILVAAGRQTVAAESFDEAMSLYDRKGNVAGARQLPEEQAAHGFTQ
jgi:hypothetical protein